MKKLLIPISCIFLLVCCNIEADYRLPVEYRGKQEQDFISIENIDGIPFFNVSELNKTLNAFIATDIIDRRLFIDLYGQRLIVLLDSPYMLFESDTYSFIYSAKKLAGRNYLPLIFLQRIMPMVMGGKVEYDIERNVLIAEPPVDTSFRTIVVDPGHGGKDPGAIGVSGRTYEKDIALSVSKLIKEIVEKNLDVQVLLTRDDDRFLPLRERTAFANEQKANLFISIHANAAPRRNAEGIEVYFLSAARTDEARAVELMENSVVEIYEGGKEAVKKYDDLTFILMDMAQAEQLRESSYFAIKLQANLVKETGAVDRGVKQAGFYVLRGAFMPSVLVEIGFLSNPREERRLNDPQYQRTIAKAIYEGVKSYIHNYEMFR